MQVCLTVHPSGRAVRLLADPGANAKSISERVAVARVALDLLLASVGHVSVSEACSNLLACIVPASAERGANAAHGVLWLAAGLSGDEVAVYVKARWDGPAEDWDRCLSLAGQMFPSSADAEAIITALRAHARPVSVGLEASGANRTRLKLYWRLSRPVALKSMGVELLGDASLSDFLARVLGARAVSPRWPGLQHELFARDRTGQRRQDRRLRPLRAPYPA